MNGFDLFVDDMEDVNTKEILIHLHTMIMDFHPGIHCKIRYKIPFYDVHSWICYLNPLKKGGVELCFIHGQQLKDPYGRLDTKGRKMISGVTINVLDNQLLESIIYYLNEAVTWDKTTAK